MAQTQEKTYTVKESQLTAQQKAELTVQEQKGNITSIVSVGKEIGIAMREGLSALNEEVNKFSQSPAGQFTMFIIAYKVIGNDAFHFVIGFPFLVIGFSLWIFFFYRNCTTRRVVVKKSGPWHSRTKEYEILNDGKQNSENTNLNRWGHFAALFIIVILSMFILFSGNGCH